MVGRTEITRTQTHHQLPFFSSRPHRQLGGRWDSPARERRPYLYSQKHANRRGRDTNAVSSSSFASSARAWVGKKEMDVPLTISVKKKSLAALSSAEGPLE